MKGSRVPRARFAEFIQQRQVEAGEDARSFGVVKANPDQSKHLETATTRVRPPPPPHAVPITSSSISSTTDAAVIFCVTEGCKFFTSSARRFPVSAWVA